MERIFERITEYPCYLNYSTICYQNDEYHLMSLICIFSGKSIKFLFPHDYSLVFSKKFTIFVAPYGFSQELISQILIFFKDFLITSLLMGF